MKSKILMLISLCLLTVGTALGQTITVKGVVTDERGDGVIGATVRLKSDATVGTMTGMDGDFTLKAKQGEIIIVSYVGYKTQEVAAAPKLVIKLVPDTELLDDLVVTAYGVQKKSSLTGSITAMDSKKIERIPTSDINKALEGVLAGVTVSSSSGAPGSKTDIRIRGIGSLNASSNPLIILDGAPYDGAINTINPADIESYNVLKDAASSALYGARGANGVILIQTKSGKEGKTHITFDAKLGTNHRGIPEYDLITDPKQYYEANWESLYNYALNNPVVKYTDAQGEEKTRMATPEEGGKYASNNLYDNLGGYLIYKGIAENEIVGTNGKINPKANELIFKDANWNDYYGALFSPKLRQEYNLTLTTGGEKSKTYFSLGYLTDKGYSLGSYFDRISTRLNQSNKFFDWLSFSNNLQFSYTDRNGHASGSTSVNPFLFTRSIAPIHPVYKHDAEGNILKDIDGNNLFEDGKEVNGVSKTRTTMTNLNPVNAQTYGLDGSKSYIVNNTLNFTFSLPYNIFVALNGTYTGEFYNIIYRQNSFGDAAKVNGRLRLEREQQHGINLNQIIDWNKEVYDGLNLALKLGHENYMMSHNNIGAQKTNLYTWHVEDFWQAAKYEGLWGGTYGYRLEGYFSQVNLDYLDKYYLSGSFRRDGSSVFHPDHRWGSFWSIGASWRASEETFIKNIEWINNLKLRASYGSQGNDYLFLPSGDRSFTPYMNLYEMDNNGTDLTFKPKYMGNENITWEKNKNFNIGLEFAILNYRLSGEIEFFQRRTSDMLFNLPVPSSTGFSTQPHNIGEMKNTGVELSLKGVLIDTENVNWTIDANLTHFKNVLTKLPEEFRKEGIRRGDQLLMEGKSIYEFNMVKWAGVDPETGTSLYYMKGKDDTEFKAIPYDANKTKDSYQYIGSSLPVLTGGFSTTLNVYGVDLSAQFSYGIGGLVYDGGYSALMDPSSIGGAMHKDLLNSWSSVRNNKSTELPRLEKDNRDLSQSSDRFLTDGSYLAVRNIMLGYTLPANWVKASKVFTAVRIYGVIDNVHLFSKRKGLDPRMSLSGDVRYNYTPMRTYTMGLSVTF